MLLRSHDRGGEDGGRMHSLASDNVRRAGLRVLVSILSGLAAVSGAAQPEKGETMYLSDVVDSSVVAVAQGWGRLGVDQAAYAGEPVGALRIGEKVYKKGLGHHAPGQLVVYLGGAYERFLTEVGVQWQGGGKGSVVFEVYADGKLLHRTGTMSDSSEPVAIDVAVKRADVLRLVARDAGDGLACDMADWAEARLVRDPAVPVQTQKPEPFDAAVYAEVLTSDPARMQGEQAGRFKPMREEDLYWEKPVVRDSDGSYLAPVDEAGRACIGLRWDLPRQVREAAITFAPGQAMPAVETAEVQVWAPAVEGLWYGAAASSTRSQGRWLRVEGRIRTEGNRWVLPMKIRTHRLRWVFKHGAGPVRVEGLAALTPSLLMEGAFTLAAGEQARQRGRTAEVTIHNGRILDKQGAVQEKLTWDMARPLTVRAKYARSWDDAGDCTVLGLRLPAADGGTLSNHAVGIGLEDVVADGASYVRAVDVGAVFGKDVGLWRETRAKVLRQPTYRGQVAALPEQTFGQALRVTRNPVQNRGFTIMSLAGGNDKYIVEEGGGVQFGTKPDKAVSTFPASRVQPIRFWPEYGDGKTAGRRYLEGDWYPIQVNEVDSGGVRYRQKTFAAPYGEKDEEAHWWVARQGLGVVWITAERKAAGEEQARVVLRATTEGGHEQGISYLLTSQGRSGPAALERKGRWVFLRKGKRLLGVVDCGGLKAWDASLRKDGLHLSGTLGQGERVELTAYLLARETSGDAAEALPKAAGLLKVTKQYWRDVVGEASSIELPDELLTNIIRASQIQCLLCSRNYDKGSRYVPWVSAMYYGVLDSETNPIMRGMTLMGYMDYARRCLAFHHDHVTEDDTFIVKPGYVLAGTGWHLWTAGTYLTLTDDKAWARQVAPVIKRMAERVIQQRHVTMQEAPDGQKVPEYGLMPPGVLADWNVFGHRFMLQGFYYRGLLGAANLLDRIGDPVAARVYEEAEALRQSSVRAYQWAQQRSPALELRTGGRSQAYPCGLYQLSTNDRLYPGEDAGRTHAYDAELGAHQMVVMGILDPESVEATAMLDHMEEIGMMHSGWHDYAEASNLTDWFNYGGFGKVQPYYGRVNQLYALRDDVKQFLRGYFNSLASLINLENLSIWEHFHANWAWNKTHETGYFLQQTYMMLAQERGEALWLAPLTSREWFRNGNAIKVVKLPSRYGPIGYSITSHVDEGYIEARVEPLKRGEPKQLVLRLRHPDEKPIKRVTIDGRQYRGFDDEAETITFESPSRPVVVRAYYR